MLLKMVSIIFLVFSSNAFADVGDTLQASRARVAGMEQAAARLAEANRATAAARNKAKESMDAAERSLKADQARVDELMKKCPPRDIGSFMLCPFATPELQRDLTKAQADRNASQKDYDSLVQQYNKSEEALVQYRGSAQRQDAQIRQENSRATQLEATAVGVYEKYLSEQMKFLGDMNDLTRRAGSYDVALQKLTQKVDMSAMGEYFQKKLQTMLNDNDTFCAAKKRCDGVGSGASDNAMKKLFSKPISGSSTTAPAVTPAAPPASRNGGGARSDNNTLQSSSVASAPRSGTRGSIATAAPRGPAQSNVTVDPNQVDIDDGSYTPPRTIENTGE